MLKTFAVSTLLAGALIASPNGNAAAAFASADAARDLGRALDFMGLQSVAAEDPDQPGSFVAALYFPGSQLLVIAARHPSVEGIRHRLELKQFREVYLDLHGSATFDGRFFVQDADADGILSALPGSGSVDVLYEDGARQTLFNGDFAAQHLTGPEYEAKLAASDARYARLLAVLTSSIK